MDIDLRLTVSEVNVIDPITKTRMTNPVRNTVCGHVYNKESLVAMLGKNKNTRCISLHNTRYRNIQYVLQHICIMFIDVLWQDAPVQPI